MACNVQNKKQIHIGLETNHCKNLCEHLKVFIPTRAAGLLATALLLGLFTTLFLSKMEVKAADSGINYFNRDAGWVEDWDEAESYAKDQIKKGEGMVEFWIYDRDYATKAQSLYITLISYWMEEGYTDYVGTQSAFGTCSLTSPYPNGAYIIFYTGTWLAENGVSAATGVTATVTDAGIEVTWTPGKNATSCTVMKSSNGYSWSVIDVPVDAGRYVISNYLVNGQKYRIKIATDNDNTWAESDEVEVTYTGKATQEFTDNSSSVSSMCPGMTATLTVQKAVTKVSFQSSNPDVVSILADGTMTAKKEGTAIITITLEGNSNYIQTSKNFEVTVGEHTYGSYNNPKRIQKVNFYFDTFADGTATCIAKKECTKCKAETEIDCSVEMKILSKANAISDGTISYIATAKEGSEEYIKTEETAIPRLDSLTPDNSKLTYTGKKVTTTVQIKDTEGNPIDSSHYKLFYSNNKNVGVATVKATFNSDYYEGTIKGQFIILPQSTELISLKGSSKALTVKWVKKANTSIGGYQIQYSLKESFKNAKTVTISGNKTSQTKLKNLQKKKTYYVRIRSFKTVKSKKYYSVWSKSRKCKTK